MRPSPLTLSLPTALLWSLLPAQEASTKPAATTVALTIRTTDQDVAKGAADAFSHPDELPNLGTGECYVMNLGADGKLTVATEKAAPGYLQVRAKPAQLAEIFAEKIEAMQQQISMFATMGAGQLGATPNEIKQLVDQVFAFPKQIEALDVDMTGSETAGFDGKVGIVPSVGGWFGKFVGDLQPNKLGAPQLGDKSAPLLITANLDSPVVGKAVQPFLGLVVGAAATDKEQKAKFSAMMEQLVGQFDGTLAFAMSDPQTQKMLVGAQDGQKLLALLDGGDFKAWRQASADANPMAEIEIKDKALTHRDVACNKQTTESSGPTGQSQTTTQFTGVVGNFLIGAGTETDTKGLIDSVLDQKVARAALPGNALVTVSAKAAELVSAMSGGMADGDGAPEKLNIALAKQGAGLSVTFQVNK